MMTAARGYTHTQCKSVQWRGAILARSTTVVTLLGTEPEPQPHSYFRRTHARTHADVCW